MIKRIHTLLLLLAVLGTLQVASANLYVSSYIQAKAQNAIVVPKEQLGSIKSLSIEGWLRPSQTMDFPFPSSVQRKSFSLIMGSSTSVSGWGDNNKGVDSFLNLYTNRWQDNSGFILAYENGKNFEYLYINGVYPNYFGRWYFVYGAYHADIQKHYFAVFDPFQNQWQDVYSPVVVKNPILSYYGFSVNAADVKKSVQFNGYVVDPTLTYLPTATYYKSTDQLVAYLSTKTAPAYIGLTAKQVFTYIGKAQATPDTGFYESFSEYRGADEYSINGQAQFGGVFSSMANTLLFRLSTNNPESFKNQYDEGDIALYAYVANGKKTCLITYRITTSTTDLSAKPCFDVVPKKGDWFYFYQGYSRKLGRVFSYVRIADKNYSQVITDVLHVDPNAFYLYVGQDTLANKWVGSFQGLNLEFGPGAYREDLITSFPPIGDKSTKDPVVIPQTYHDPAILQSKATQTLAIDAQIVDQKYIAAVSEYAVHFWFRRDLITPELVDFQAAKAQQSVAGVTERDDYTSTAVLGDGALSILYLDHATADSPGLVFSTYNDLGSDSLKTATFNYDTKYDQGQWHWVYFAYSKTLQQASIYVVLEGGQVKFSQQINNVSHSTAHNLKSLLGKSGTTLNPVTGQFYDFQFVYYNGCYQAGAASVETYFSQKVAKAPNTKPAQGVYPAFDRLYFTKANPPTQAPLSLTTQANGALQYAVAGWARWNSSSFKNQIGNLLFTLSFYNKDTIGKGNSKLGALVLQVHYKYKHLIFSTYNYAHKKAQDVNPTIQSVFVPKKARTSWCYHYLGYSHLDQKVVGSIQCLSGFKYEYTFAVINHIIPTELTFQVGKDVNLNIWKGEVFKPSVIIGYPLPINFAYDAAYHPTDPTTGQLSDQNDPTKDPTDDDNEPEESDDPVEPKKPDPTPVVDPTPAKPVVDPTPAQPVVDPTPAKPVIDPTPAPIVTPTPAPVVDPVPVKPAEPACAQVYSECGYVKDLAKICENIPSFDLREIRSIKMPEGVRLIFYQDVNYSGLNVKFLTSVECIELGLRVDPKVQWAQLSQLFTAGKITFVNNDGHDVDLNTAEHMFFKSKNQEKSKVAKHLKKNKKHHHHKKEKSLVELTQA